MERYDSFICKEGQIKQVYNDFLIVIEPELYSCWIIEQTGPTKFKKRREIMGPSAGRCDEYGNKLFKRPESTQWLITKAQNYIDNHIVKWANSKNNYKNFCPECKTNKHLFDLAENQIGCSKCNNTITIKTN